MFGASIHVGEPLLLPGEAPDATYDVSWSFVVCAVAASTNTLAVILLILEYVNGRILRYVHTTYIPNNFRSQRKAGRSDTSLHSPYTTFPDMEVTLQPDQHNGTEENTSIS